MKMGFLVYELGFRPKLAWELGFEAWELGFRPKLGWELGFRTPLQDPLYSMINVVIISKHFTVLFANLDPPTKVVILYFRTPGDVNE